MKNLNLILSGLVAIIVLGYFAFIGYQKSKSQNNIFLAKEDVEIETLAPQHELLKSLRYKNRTFKVEDLPLSIQKRLKNEELIAHKKMQTIVKDFLVRFHVKAKESEDPFSVSAADIPPLIEISKKRVGMDRVEKIYKKNLDVLPKDHDPGSVKAQIYAELVTMDSYDYLVNQLAEIYRTKNTALPEAPKIDVSWLMTEKFSPSYGNEDAPLHLIWIGFYGCTECKNFTKDLGLLIKKYGLENFKITFIPWTKRDIDIFAYFNLTAFCVREELGDTSFWNFHSIAMNRSDVASKIKFDDLKRAKAFTSEVLKAANIDQESQAKIKACAKGLNESNKLLVEMTKAKEKLTFLPDVYSPMAILNGRKLDLEGRTLFLALEDKLKGINQ